jgi:hypothetical protein
MTFKLPQPKSYYVAILRPYRMREQFTQKGWDQVGEQVEMAMKMTQSDIDHGASGHIMVDKRFQSDRGTASGSRGGLLLGLSSAHLGTR